MRIDKLYFTLPEVLDRWAISEADIVYLAENDKLRLSVRVFDMAIEFRDQTETSDRGPGSLACQLTPYSGLLDLHACDVYKLFRCGEINLSDFRTPSAERATLRGDAEPLMVMIGDLLLRREERDRFETECGFVAGGPPIEEPTFVHSADYLEVGCHGYRFKLGPIQADVVRTLHLAALRGDMWQNGKVILTRSGSKCLRMADVFKSQKDWKHLIRSNRRGGYRLNLD